MKKIFTLALGSLLMFAASAADRKPTVTVNSSKKYEVVIDGRSIQTGDARGYQSMASVNIPFLRDGRHTVEVYQLSKGIFQKRKIMVSSSNFQMRNNDITINVDMFGKIKITESRSRFDQDNHGWGSNQGRDDHNAYDKDHGKRF